MKFFKAMQAPRSADDEVAVERLMAIANRSRTGRTGALANDLDAIRQADEPEPES